MSSPFDNTLEKQIENGVFSLKTHHKCLSPHHARDIWKRYSHLSCRICGWGKLGAGKSQGYRDETVTKSSVFQVFSVHAKSRKAAPAFSNSSCLKSVFQTFRLHDRLRWKAGLTNRNKAAFSNFSVVVLTGPKRHSWPLDLTEQQTDLQRARPFTRFICDARPTYC